jgi:hypothetical protein
VSREHIEQMTQLVYAAVAQYVSVPNAAVRLRDGGVIVTYEDGYHIHVLVQPVHFVPGEELPF